MGEHPMSAFVRQQHEDKKRQEAQEVDKLAREIRKRMCEVGLPQAIAEQIIKLKGKRL